MRKNIQSFLKKKNAILGIIGTVILALLWLTFGQKSNSNETIVIHPSGFL